LATGDDDVSTPHGGSGQSDSVPHHQKVKGEERELEGGVWSDEISTEFRGGYKEPFLASRLPVGGSKGIGGEGGYHLCVGGQRPTRTCSTVAKVAAAAVVITFDDQKQGGKEAESEK